MRKNDLVYKQKLDSYPYTIPKIQVRRYVRLERSAVVRCQTTQQVNHKKRDPPSSVPNPSELILTFIHAIAHARLLLLYNNRDHTIQTVRRRRTTSTTGVGGGLGGKATSASKGTSGAKPTSLPRKRRVAGATTSAGETRKLKRRPRSPTSGGGADGTPGVKALVVTDDMELADMMALVKDVLERLSETERDLRRLRKEGSLVKPNRVRGGGVGVLMQRYLQ